MAKAFTTDRTPDLSKAFPMKKENREGANVVTGIGGRIKIGLEATLGYGGTSNLSVTEDR